MGCLECGRFACRCMTLVCDILIRESVPLNPAPSAAMGSFLRLLLLLLLSTPRLCESRFVGHKPPLLLFAHKRAFASGVLPLGPRIAEVSCPGIPHFPHKIALDSIEQLSPARKRWATGVNGDGPLSAAFLWRWVKHPDLGGHAAGQLGDRPTGTGLETGQGENHPLGTPWWRLVIRQRAWSGRSHAPEEVVDILLRRDGTAVTEEGLTGIHAT